MMEDFLQLNETQNMRASRSRDEGRGGYNCHVCGDRFSMLKTKPAKHEILVKRKDGGFSQQPDTGRKGQAK